MPQIIFQFREQFILHADQYNQIHQKSSANQVNDCTDYQLPLN